MIKIFGWCSLAIAALLAAGCSQSSRSPTADEIRCQILTDYTERTTRDLENRHLTEELKHVHLSYLKPRSDWGGERLTKGALEESEDAEPNALSDLRIFEERAAHVDNNPFDECPELEKLRSEVSYKPTADEVGKTVDAQSLFYGYWTIYVSIPGVDLESGRAGFDASTVCGPLCANGVFVTYKRNVFGVWILEAETETWIS